MAPNKTIVYKSGVVNLGHVNMSHECKHTHTQKQTKINKNKQKQTQYQNKIK